METLAFGLFTITGVWVWLCIALWLILSFTYMEKESGTGIFVVFLIFLGILHMGGVVNILTTLFANPITVILTGLSYFVAGTIWTLLKFKLYVRKKRIEINAAIDSGKYDVVKKDGRNYYGSQRSLESDMRDLSVSENKYHIIRWAVWWPFSVIWTVLRDFVRDVFDWILTEVVGRSLEAISSGEAAKIKKERIKTPPEDSQ